MAFDRTYEGLKRGVAKLQLPHHGPAFDRTYEGLKPEDGIGDGHLPHVF